MNRLTITPIIRGAYMEALGGPVILLSSDEERSELPELKIDLKGADNGNADNKGADFSEVYTA